MLRVLVFGWRPGNATSSHIKAEYCTECWSQGRAKLIDFLRQLARENMQLSPSFTPTLGSEEMDQ